MTCRRCDHPIVVRHDRRHRQAPPGVRVHEGRGLCAACAQGLRRHDPDALLDYPPAHRRRDEVLADYQALRAEGLTVAQIAERIGMSHAALERALTRARSAGVAA